ncbi:MAG TPA: hypothetical protein VFR76_04230 [Verrucomicrobiae bacterium]|nr:hypothetical protein [Verrucomicrobiae bacterium]
MQKIYLAKPGGQREGPYTLEQINHDLATKKYRDEDFWAWHEGLPSWMPLYALPGVSAKAAPVAVPEAEPQPAVPKTEPKRVPEVEAQPTAPAAASTTSKAEVEREPEAPKAEAATAAIATAAAEAARLEAANPPVAESRPEARKPSAAGTPIAEPEPEPQKAEAATAPVAEPKSPEFSATPSMSSGKPFSALEQIFILTTGEGPSAFPSAVTTAMLVEAVGETLDNIRAKVPVDVIGRADAAVLKTIRAGSIPDSAWRVLFAIKPAIAQQAQDGAYHLCVRAFPVESNEAVALFLLYNKQKP